MVVSDQIKHMLEDPKKHIPRGTPYCYSGRRWEGRCPFWTLNTNKPYQQSGYCHYLGLGDWESKGLSLLWDQVKECDIGKASPDAGRQ
jgi:hypothetical protein